MKAKLKDLTGQEIWFVRMMDRKTKDFPNNDFGNSVCYVKYNNEDERVKYYEYVLECSKGNGYLNDGSDVVEYYTRKENPEYFL